MVWYQLHRYYYFSTEAFRDLLGQSLEKAKEEIIISYVKKLSGYLKNYQKKLIVLLYPMGQR